METRIGDYVLAGRLGSGGQGVVYDAYDPEGRRVAVKVLHTEGSRDRLAKEAAAAGRVASYCTAKVLATDLTGAGRTSSANTSRARACAVPCGKDARSAATTCTDSPPPSPPR
ncbi:hypothetical protein [Nonomuraea dietziae]|uniref:hypothetical protein n=1 Tax=Nonomuraea dietziae TaxID=65515 RepID=UPI0031D52318